MTVLSQILYGVPYDTAPGGAAKIAAAINQLNGMISQYDTLILPTGDTTGVADAANITAAATLLTNSYRQPPGSSSYSSTGRILLGAGDFYFTGTLSSLFASGRKMGGFWMQGYGRGVTRLNYQPSTAQPMFINQYWLDVKMTDMTIYSSSNASDFMWCQEQHGATNIQDFTFVDIEWSGLWNSIFRLTGGNNNSEWKFSRCTVNAGHNNWIYTPQGMTGTFTSGSSTIAISNTLGQYQLNDTCVFNTSVAPVVGNTPGPPTNCYVVAVTTSSIQVSLTSGGTPIVFTATTGTTTQIIQASDQFLNFWFHQCKYDSVCQSGNMGQWINMYYGGSIKITDCDVSGYMPTAAQTYLFNLMGNPVSGGTCCFQVNGLRMEHASDLSGFLYCLWPNGTIAIRGYDSSSQEFNRSLGVNYVYISNTNARGPNISWTDCNFLGTHSYAYNTSNYEYPQRMSYKNCDLLQTPNGAAFIVTVPIGMNGNSGGQPLITFDEACRSVTNDIPGFTGSITSGSSSIGISNNYDQLNVGCAGTFATSIAPMTSGTVYYVVSASLTTMTVSATLGGSAISFTATGSSVFTLFPCAEALATELNWHQAQNGAGKAKSIQFYGTSSNGPTSNKYLAVKVPINALITAIRFTKFANSNSGAFDFTVQTNEATPRPLLHVSGSNAASAFTAQVTADTTGTYSTYASTFPLWATSDAIRELHLYDTYSGGRTNAFQGYVCTVEYMG